MPGVSNAVFLSYASDDAAAAERIATALRTAGVEVWFDKSELRGGDAWDRQIRDQIHDCRLFVAVISAHTEARDEGYFRREWRLAVERAGDMHEKKAFLVPVVIDGTSERGAAVPEKFRELQWTRLPGGETPSAFVDRIKRLLSPEPQATSKTDISAGTVPTLGSARSARSVKRAVLAAVVVAIVGVGTYLAYERPWAPKRAMSSALPPAASASATPTAFNPPPHSIAVLPFVNMSGDKEQEYFADGLAEELLDLLAKTPGLHVIARTSSFSFKGKSEDIPTIATKLNVATILEGSVRKSGNRLRVTTQLVRASDGEHLWSETYDRALKDVFQVQDEIAGAVVSALKLKLAPEAEGPSSRRTTVPEAYNQYLLGRQFFDRRSEEDFRRAVEAFRQAIELDPRYAAAYAELALVEGFADQTSNPEVARHTLALADKAVELAPDEPDGYAVRGYLRLTDNGDWSGAQGDLEKALALDSRNTTALGAYSELLVALGRLPQAIAEVKTTTELDPLSNGSWTTLGLYLMSNRQYAPAHEALRRALEIAPESPEPLSWLGELQLLEGSPMEALTTFHRVSTEGYRLWGVAMAEHTLGHTGASQLARDELIRKYAHGWAYTIATVYAWCGEAGKAFEWLELSYQQRDGDLHYIKTDPLLASLHGHARYDAMLRKMNLPE